MTCTLGCLWLLEECRDSDELELLNWLRIDSITGTVLFLISPETFRTSFFDTFQLVFAKSLTALEANAVFSPTVVVITDRLCDEFDKPAKLTNIIKKFDSILNRLKMYECTFLNQVISSWKFYERSSFGNYGLKAILVFPFGGGLLGEMRGYIVRARSAQFARNATLQIAFQAARQIASSHSAATMVLNTTNAVRMVTKHRDIGRNFVLRASF